jgi:hypothetical protein
VPAFTVDQPPEAMGVLEKRAAEKKVDTSTHLRIHTLKNFSPRAFLSYPSCLSWNSLSLVSSASMAEPIQLTFVRVERPGWEASISKRFSSVASCSSLSEGQT